MTKMNAIRKIANASGVTDQIKEPEIRRVIEASTKGLVETIVKEFEKNRKRLKNKKGASREKVGIRCNTLRSSC
jgi:hypothetical protein